MATKMGQKRTQPKNFHANRPGVPLAQVSPKHAKELRGYNAVRDQLIKLCNGKSELSGNRADSSIENSLSPHHILGRAGARLTNPFNLIILLEREHWVAQDTMSWEHKHELLTYIKPIRIAQGYKESDYEPLNKTFSFGEVKDG